MEENCMSNAKKAIEKIVNELKFEDWYVEATFQFRLMMKLAKSFGEDNIFPERNIKYYGIKPAKIVKKEIDIVLEEKGSNTAIELKMPMNGKVPEQMFDFAKDIYFLEQLKASGNFSNGLFIAVTNDNLFWENGKKSGIYAPYRADNLLKGTIKKPTGKTKKEFRLSGTYQIEWKSLNNGFRYFIVEV
jgi:hypothetical protein